MTARAPRPRSAWLLAALLVSTAGCAARDRPADAPAAPTPRHPRPAVSEAVRKPDTKPRTRPRRAAFDPRVALSDEGPTRFVRRAKLSRIGPVRLTRAGEPTIPHRARMRPSTTSPLVVVADTETELRVVADEGRLRLLLWLDRDDFHAVVTEIIPLSQPATGAGRQGPGIRLYPGFALPSTSGTRSRRERRQSGRAGDDDQPEEERRVELRHRGDSFSFEGSVPERTTGHIYTPVPQLPVLRNAVVAPGTALRISPGGQAIGTFSRRTSRADYGVQLLGAAAANHVRIRYVGDDFEVEGYALAEAVTNGSSTARRRSGFRARRYGRSTNGRTRVSVPPGTCLHPPGEGAPVGVVIEEVAVMAAPDELGYWVAGMPTRWGLIDVWLDAAGATGDAGEGAPPADKPRDGVPTSWRRCR